MCEFISAIRIEGRLLYIDDQALTEKKTHKILAKDNDSLGHEFLRELYDLSSGQGEEIEVQDFWNSEKLPEELRLKLANFQSFKSNFGKLITNHAQTDVLDYIIKNAPKTKEWQGLQEFCQNIIKDRILKNTKVIKLQTPTKYSATVDQLVKESKFDGYVNSNINDQNFPEAQKPDEDKPINLVNFGIYLSSEDVSKNLDELDLKSATTKELLSVSIAHPDEQRKHPIVALGSVWQNYYGNRYAPVLDEYSDERSLDLNYWDGDWDDRWWFAAVSK